MNNAIPGVSCLQRYINPWNFLTGSLLNRCKNPLFGLYMLVPGSDVKYL